MMDEDIELQRIAHELYLKALGPIRADGRELFSYDIVEVAEDAPWKRLFSGEGGGGDLRKMINQIHQ